MDRLSGKKALITGGASGLGRAIAELFADEGASVALTDIQADGGAAVATAINRRYPGRALSISHDVTKPEDWRHALESAAQAFGGLNILVNNAGISIKGTIEETRFEDWQRVLSVDLDSVFLGCKLAIPFLRQSAPSAIVNISSIAGIIAGHNMAAYNAAKAGVLMLTKSVALHCARKRYDIRCNSVHPSFIDTPILRTLFDTISEEEGRAKLAR